MNDRRFIELLNLYVDQELPEDAARQLENEIAQRPERRRVYSQYCRMQRACVRLLAQPSAPAPRIEAMLAAAAQPGEAPPEGLFTVPAEPAIRPARSGQRATAWWGWGSGAMAAAACVALVLLLGGTRSGEPDPGASGQPAAIATADPGTTPEGAVAGDMTSPTYRAVVAVNALPWTSAARAGEAAAVISLDEPSLAWLQELRLTPIRQLSFESLQFDSRGGIKEPVEPSTFVQDGSEPPATSELHAFEFQR